LHSGQIARVNRVEAFMKSTLLLTALLAAGAAFGEEASGTAPYRLSFTVHETENGRSAGAKTYSMLVLPRNQQRLSIGTKLPVPTASGNNTQFTYVDVGMNVRARVEERDASLRLGAEVEVSGLAGDRENAGRAAPHIQQFKASIDTIVPLGRATPVVSMDDPSGPKHYEIEVTATKVK
jgi:hypothetical protein